MQMRSPSEPPHALQPTTGWTITITAVRADRPRVRTRKTYRLSDQRYHAAADTARRLAHMAGLVDVLIVGVVRETTPHSGTCT